MRLLIAAALFPPKMVKRLRESEDIKFSDVWRRSREYQLELSHDNRRTLTVGAMNLAFSLCLLGLGSGVLEALGMSLPGSSSTPAEDPQKLSECRSAGAAIRHVSQSRFTMARNSISSSYKISACDDQARNMPVPLNCRPF